MTTIHSYLFILCALGFWHNVLALNWLVEPAFLHNVFAQRTLVAQEPMISVQLNNSTYNLPASTVLLYGLGQEDQELCIQALQAGALKYVQTEELKAAFNKLKSRWKKPNKFWRADFLGFLLTAHLTVWGSKFIIQSYLEEHQRRYNYYSSQDENLFGGVRAIASMMLLTLCLGCLWAENYKKELESYRKSRTNSLEFIAKLINLHFFSHPRHHKLNSYMQQCTIKAWGRGNLRQARDIQLKDQPAPANPVK